MQMEKVGHEPGAHGDQPEEGERSPSLGQDKTATVCILIPVYNERYRVGETVEQVLQAPLPDGLRRHLVVVDDGSTDGTEQVLREVADRYPDVVTLIRHERNQGKGAAVRTAIQAARGEFAIIQDADLEYDPQDYPTLLAPMLNHEADAVFGSRLRPRVPAGALLLARRGQRAPDHPVQHGTNLNLTDMETGYKAFRLDILKSIPLRSNRFGMEPEITAKVAEAAAQGSRGAHLLSRPHLPGGQEDHLERRPQGPGRDHLLLAGRRHLREQYGHAILHRLSGTHRFNRWMADTIKPFVGQRVLEIGSGLGNLTGELLPRDHYTASDIDDLHLRFLRNRYARNQRVGVWRHGPDRAQGLRRDGRPLRHGDLPECPGARGRRPAGPAQHLRGLEPGGSWCCSCRRDDGCSARWTRCWATTAATPGRN